MLIATSLAEPPVLITPLSTLDLGAISTCSGYADSTITFTNTGCGPDTITSVTVGGGGFSEISDTLPMAVAAGDSVRLHVRFVPPGAGAFAGTMTVGVTSMGLTENIDIGLNASGTQGMGLLNVASTSLAAGSFSICSGDTTVSASIGNVGCDTLVISDVRLTGDADFSLANVLTDSLLPPNASGQIAVHFAPSRKGNRSAVLTFHERNLHGGDIGHDTTITISGSVHDGTRFIAQSIRSADLGPLYPCEERDTSFWLTNAGCDTLTIDSASFDNAMFAALASLPITLPPGDSTRIAVHFTPDTTGRPTAISGLFSAHSNDDSGHVVLVPVTVEVVYPVALQLGLAASNDRATAGDHVTFTIELTGDIPRGLSALQFDLTHDDDLLSYDGLTGTGLTIDKTTMNNSMMTQSFTLAPVTVLGAVGTLDFTVRLARASSTPVTLSNVHASTALPLPIGCIASLDADTGGGVTYEFTCGQDLLHQFLLTGAIASEPNYPNPLDASNGFKTTIPFETNAGGTAKITITNESGVKVCDETEDLLGAGHHFFYFSAARLSAGTYYYQIEFPKGVVIVSKTMVIVK